MRRILTIAMVAAAASLMGASAATALLLDAKTDAQKWRKDYQKQANKYAQCITKAVVGCEKKGASTALECDAATGLVDPNHPDVIKGKEPAKFQGKLAKCDSKLDLAKKQAGLTLEDIGCLGDCDNAADGNQACANVAAAQAALTASDGPVKGAVSTLGAVLGPLCPPGDVACVNDAAAQLGKYLKFFQKCAAKCEDDYKGKFGNGGPSEGPDCLDGDPGASTAAQSCFDAAVGKAKIGAAASAFLPLLRPTLNNATDDGWNLFDPVAGPGTGPFTCGDCGNNIREGAEDCDGTDDALCPGSCIAADDLLTGAQACTCP